MAGYRVLDYNEGVASEAGLVHDPGESDFRLLPGSPCIDRAVPIRGINDAFEGKAPDIGAHEFRSEDSAPVGNGPR